MLLKNILGRMIYFDASTDGGGGTPPVVPPVVPPAAEPPKTFTQDEVNTIITNRLAREKQTAADEKAKAEQTALEAEKSKTADAEAKAKAADLRIIKTEAKVAALTAGTKPERVDAVMKLADLSAVTIGANGEPDAAALKAAVDAVLKLYPEFKGTGASKSGEDFGGGNDPGPLTKAKILAMSPADRTKNHEAIKAYFTAHPG